MTKAYINYLISEGYDLLEGGKPYKIYGDLWEYLDGLDEDSKDVYVLEDLLNWSVEELKCLTN